MGIKAGFTAKSARNLVENLKIAATGTVTVTPESDKQKSKS
jgi:hypothetical protein